MLGFDTETVNRPGGGHACLLTASDGRYLEPKNFDECFNFLAVEKERLTDACAYNMDFDFTAICHENLGISYRVLERLAIFGYSEFARYSIEYIPSKFARVRRGRRGFVLYDLAQFFGCSLRKAAEKFLTGETKDDIPKEWYKEIDRCLGDSRREKVLQYALRDARIVHLLFGKLCGSFNALGLSPKRWTSPACLSSLVFGGIAESEPRIPCSWQEGFRRSYFGGRIEIGGIGATEGPLNVYDINSAYPAEIAKLPSLSGCSAVWSGPTWKRNSLTRYGSYHIEVSIPKDWSWGPLAVEDGSKVLFPVGNFRTWCGKAGLELLERYGVPFVVRQAFEYIGPPSPPIYSTEIHRLYEARKNPVLKLAAKLVMNGWYGKLAEARKKSRLAVVGGRWHGFQRLSSREVYGRYTCFPMAAAITENVRLRVWEILHRFGKDAIMAMTDAVMIRGDLPTGSGLGEWGRKMAVNKGVVLGCGRYWLEGKDEDGDDADDFHFRGFSVDRGNLRSLQEARGRTCKVKDLRAERLTMWTRNAGQGELNVLRDVGLEFNLEDDKRYFPTDPPDFEGIFKRGEWVESVPWEMFQKGNKREKFNFA